MRENPFENYIGYHVYITSFFRFEDNKDLVRFKQKTGNLKGILQKLKEGYFKELGINLIWLSPFYDGPWIDGGYDATDFFSVHPDLGTIKDIKDIVKEAHSQGIRIIQDLVMGHTSDQHELFQLSKESWMTILEYEDLIKKEGVENVKPLPNRIIEDANFYVWVPKKYKTNYNNSANFKAWINSKDVKGMSYQSSFLPNQPRLNLRNPKVKEYLKSIIIFWRKLGIDGFRIDMSNALVNGESVDEYPMFYSDFYKKYIYPKVVYKNNPFKIALPSDKNPTLFQEARYTLNTIDNILVQKEIFEGIYKDLPEGPGIIMGEFIGRPDKQSDYVSFMDAFISQEYLVTNANPASFKDAIFTLDNDWHDLNSPAIFLSTHDRSRIFERVKKNMSLFKKYIALQMMTPGIPFIFNGDEWAQDHPKLEKEHITDALKLRYSFLPSWIKKAISYIFYKDEVQFRDYVRAPLSWNSSMSDWDFLDEALFSSSCKTNNLEEVLKDPKSAYYIYKFFTEFRKEYRLTNPRKSRHFSSEVFGVKFLSQKSEFSLLISFSKEPKTINFAKKHTMIFSSDIMSCDIDITRYTLKPDEICLFKL